jgi:hypothetical protein
VTQFADIEARIAALRATPGDAGECAAALLGLGEAVLEGWIEGRGETPTDAPIPEPRIRSRPCRR